MASKVVLWGGFVTAFIAGAGVTSLYYKSQFAEHEAAIYAEATQAANKKLETLSAWNNNMKEALEDANTKLAETSRAHAAATAELGRLRNDTQKLRAALAGYSRTTVNNYAATAGELLTECSSRYSELAAKADGHAADVSMLLKAWPVRSPYDSGKTD